MRQEYGGKRAEASATAVLTFAAAEGRIRRAIRVPAVLELTEAGDEAFRLALGEQQWATMHPNDRTTLREAVHAEALEWMTAEAARFREMVASLHGLTFDLLIPMQDAGREIEYLFTFKLELALTEAWDPPLETP